MSNCIKKDIIEDEFTSALYDVLDLDKNEFKFGQWKNHTKVYINGNQSIELHRLIVDTQKRLNDCAERFGYQNNPNWCAEVVNMFFDFIPI